MQAAIRPSGTAMRPLANRRRDSVSHVTAEDHTVTLLTCAIAKPTYPYLASHPASRLLEPPRRPSRETLWPTAAVMTAMPLT